MRLSLAVALLLINAACPPSASEVPRCGTPEAPDCGAHGSCVNAESGAACTCQTAYTGPACIACATGFQDNDADGTCLPTCATLATTCSDHGTCGDGSGAATCTCTTAYSGPTCAACATGYQDNDGDGACTAACQSSSCGTHGSCADSTGTTVCTCAPGYAGALCNACATGFQDNDGDGACTAACQSSSCSAHGSCTDSTGTTVCTCAAGYAGALCNTCAMGFQDRDGDGACAPACASSSCPANATCDDATGAVVCTCTAAYTGTGCTACAAGYQDNDLNGSCLPTCASASLACAPRAACSDLSGEARCGCMAGYAGSDGGVGCAWVGVVRDPGLQGNPPAQWLAVTGVSWTPGSAGGVDPGSASLGGACTYSTLSQTGITVPPMSTPDRLALRVSRMYSGGYTGTLLSLGPTLAYDLSAVAGWNSVDLCLGEAAYGGSHTLALRSTDVGQSTCAGASPPSVDRVDLVPSATCPANGTVFNGTLEDTATVGWSLSNGASIVPNGAVNGSRALRISGAVSCFAQAGSWVAVPAAATLSSPALRFAVSGPAGARLQVMMPTYPWATVATTGPGQTVTLCLPAWTQGQALPLAFSQDLLGCTTSWTGDLDNFTVVSEPSCAGLGTNPYNPGFELADLSLGFSVNDPSAIAVDTSTGVAHSGAGALRVAAPAVCSLPPSLYLAFGVPPPTVTAGPALHFWYRLASSPAGSFSADVIPAGAQSGVASAALTATAWTRVTMCLPAKLAGTLAGLSLRAPFCSGTAGPSMWVDDVDVSVDSSCPP
ncbi:MAG: hypothetical protein IT380_28755 [Myxococcales bacterium]|nr:hypothetical protein [Myxococcales bacterium]